MTAAPPSADPATSRRSRAPHRAQYLGQQSCIDTGHDVHHNPGKSDLDDRLQRHRLRCCLGHEGRTFRLGRGRHLCRYFHQLITIEQERNGIHRGSSAWMTFTPHSPAQPHLCQRPRLSGRDTPVPAVESEDVKLQRLPEIQAASAPPVSSCPPFLKEFDNHGRSTTLRTCLSRPSCLAAERYWDQARWATGAYAWRFDGLERAPRAG